MFKTDLARENWDRKYRYGNETEIQTWERVARALADTEKEPEKWYDLFLRTIVKFDKDNKPTGLKCTPGGRITANIGTGFKGATLSNCFINGPVSGAQIKYTRKSSDGSVSYPIEYNTSDNPDDLLNIFLTIMEQAKTLASEGGYGINFGFIRPRGSIIKGTGIKHPGVLAYLKIWDSVAECIVKGDQDGYVDKIKNYLGDEKFEELKQAVKKETRKGAMLAALDCSHPDIEEFVRAKQTSGVLTKFNMSVLMDDLFLSSVERDDYYEQKFDGKVYKKIKARDLYNLIMESCYHRAEPGVLFYDNMQKNNPISYLGKTNATNPSLRGDTRVLTDKGIIPIEELQGKSFLVQNLNGKYSKAKCILSGKNKKLFKLSLGNGRSIYCTGEHKWPTLLRGGGWSKVETKDLRVGNLLPFLSGNFNICFDNKFTEDEGFFLGWLYGDGWITQRKGRPSSYGFIFNQKERYVAEKVLKIINKIKKELNEDLVSICKDKDGCFIIQVGSKGFDDLLKEKYGVLLKKDGFPKIIWKSNKQFILGFLDGILSSDGHVGKIWRNKKTDNTVSVRIAFSTSIEKMKDDMHDLLGFMGVKSTSFMSKTRDVSFPNGKNYNKEYTRYQVCINFGNIFDFPKSFSFTQKEKQIRFSNILKLKKQNKSRAFFNLVKVSRIEETQIKESVWDIQVFDATHCFRISSAITGNCGEISGLPTLTTVCLLGSLNLTQYVEIKDDTTSFDWEQYGKDIQVFARMLDNVCDLSNAPLPSYMWAIKNLRQFGMGLNGLGSALMMLGIPYNSKEAVDFSKKIAKIKENLTWQVSANLAKEKGVFPAYDKKKFEDTEYFKSDRLSDEIKGLLKRYGARNGKTTTCAPAGSSSILVDNVSNSIEPVFRVEYDRKMVCKDWPEGLTRENIKTVLTYRKKKDYEYWEGIYNNKKYYYEPQNRGLCEITLIRDYGYQWLLDNFPKKDHGKYLITTKDLTVDDHLAIQEVIQRFNNQSTSKTVNVPNKYPFKDFKDLYLTGWKKGLVGLTTYREGSMESVLSSIEEERTIIKKDLKLPNTFINGPTSVIKKEGMKFYIHFSYFPDDTELKHPVCLWIYTNSEEKGASIVCNKASRELVKLALSCGIDNKIIAPVIDKCKMDYPHNRLGRVISMCLRHNIPREDILGSLYNIEGDNISTLLFSVRKFISSTMTDGTKIKNFKCPSCKGDNLVYQGGCYSCCDCHAVGC